MSELRANASIRQIGKLSRTYTDGETESESREQQKGREKEEEEESGCVVRCVCV